MKEQSSIPTGKVQRASKFLKTGAKIGGNFVKHYAKKMSKDRWSLVRFLGILFLGVIIALTGSCYIHNPTHQVIGASLYGIGLFLFLGGLFTMGFSKDFFIRGAR